ncbi:hypothetical protein Y1Q_0016666 [Alligator mississippiensis]|uniref:Uncharacterized protein n=1 Tax=Alligator mississippiensis TaxID=8496 RepID=A0A151P1X0_ALLMI|nr:hypothetical protein Y1Q_0016666 [Alligator mississippiensis]
MLGLRRKGLQLRNPRAMTDPLIRAPVVVGVVHASRSRGPGCMESVGAFFSKPLLFEVDWASMYRDTEHLQLPLTSKERVGRLSYCK